MTASPTYVTLTPNTVSTVTLDGPSPAVRITNISGGFPVYVSLTATNPTVEGNGFMMVNGSRLFPTTDQTAAPAVRLISAGPVRVVVENAQSVDADELFEIDYETSDSNLTGIVDASAARTTSGTGATQTNEAFRGALIGVVVTAASGTSPTLAVRLQVSPDGGTNWVDLDAANAVTASITAAGTHFFEVYPGLTNTAASRANAALPRTWRLAWTIGGTSPSFTFATYVNYID